MNTELTYRHVESGSGGVFPCLLGVTGLVLLLTSGPVQPEPAPSYSDHTRLLVVRDDQRNERT